jgi:tetratricopeptide (TPR) repeat protein
VNGAVEMYERAVNRYAEGGYPNNAIALCNKILRSAPGRNHIYLTLAQLMVQRGFVAEAKKNFVEYAQRMADTGKLDEAFDALKRFADISPENEEIRLMLAEQLKAAARDDDAREQIDKLMEGGGKKDTKRASQLLEKVRAVDPEYDVEGTGIKPKSEELIFIPLDDEPARDNASRPGAARVPSREPARSMDTAVETPTTDDEDTSEVEVEGVGGLETSTEFDTAAAADVKPLEIESTTETTDEDLSFLGAAEQESTDHADNVAGLEVPHLDLDTAFEETDDEESDLVILNSGEEVGVREGDAEAEDIDTAAPDVAGASVAERPQARDDLMMIEVDDLEPTDLATASAQVDAQELETPESRLRALEVSVEDDPDNPQVHREFAEALIEAGEREHGLQELDQALQRYEARRAWGQAAAVAEEILRLEPNSVTHHQKRVEYAYRLGEKSQLVSAYLALGNALFRSGALDRARAIYERVLEHDPDNASARDAIANLTPSEPEPAVAPSTPRKSGYVDLGEFILGEDKSEKDTRLRVEEDEPSGDEQRDFDEMLQQFKRGIEENLDDEDSQAHYDLGVAFKEMGLLDEAIAEFQKALRSPDTRLASAEMLGLCFIEKGQHEVAATVLRRAVEGDPSTDEEKVGVLYWLARCEEEKSRYAEALSYYRRVFAVDIHFQDVGRRVDALVKAAGG